MACRRHRRSITFSAGTDRAALLHGLAVTPTGSDGPGFTLHVTGDFDRRQRRAGDRHQDLA